MHNHCNYYRINYIHINNHVITHKGEIEMTNEVKESRLTILKREAIERQDFKLAIELDKIESELDQKTAEARKQGLMVGFGTAVVCVVMGGVVTKVIVSKQTE